MSSFFCCFAKDSEDVDSDTRNVISPYRPSSPTPPNGCCCYRFFTSSCTDQRQRKKRYISREAPQVCDAAVDTEIDFGIVLHDISKTDDTFAEGEHFEENMKDHKYASLQFDTKPGKVQYVEGSQVFYVEVRDKKMSPLRRYSCDKNISEDDLESDISVELLSDSKTDTYRRSRGESETKPRKKFTDVPSHGILYVSSKWSPATSMDSLSDKKSLNRVYLHNIQEDHENTRNQLSEDDSPTTSKEGYNIDGGHFVAMMSSPDENDIRNTQSESQAETSSSVSSFQTCIHNDPVKPESNRGTQDYESEFADESNQSAQNTRSTSDLATSSPIITISSAGADPNVVPLGLFHESLFSLDCPLSKNLTDDPSGLIIGDRTNSYIDVNKQESSVRESTSCPDITVRSDQSVSSLRNSVMAESLNTESGVLSVETQTDLLDDGNLSEILIPRTPRHSVNSVSTETDFEIIEDPSKFEIEEENAESVITQSNNSENNESVSNEESLSSTGTECDSIFGDSDSSSSSGQRQKKKEPLNSSESTGSSGSSSPKSVQRLDSKPYEHKGKAGPSNSKSSSSSVVGSSSSSSSNSLISSPSSSSSSTSSSSTNEVLCLKAPEINV